ncbi:hypothetical protein BDN72DRAFT_308713 [Pluteus cervinus]|uniref:Uncharacterized protein n=1 Tax=Pluteus cervinus TaxID=181527 RepID=A0ACD3ACK6_9AGAR|nr:hypothetical protein BDN72DRAFT_308713 [Pluteus cervinus]
MASSKIDDTVEESIRNGYTQSQSIVNVSNIEHGYDRAVEMGAGVSKNGLLESFSNFFDQNRVMIESTATGLASLTSEGRSMESAVSSFSEKVNVVMEGLGLLAQVHPAIGLAVIAFRAVIMLDMKRRENNKKVLALKIEMQDMMIELFELRHIRDPTEAGPDGKLLGSRMQALMVKIEQDIKEAGSVCDAYMKKSFLARTLKSSIYENRLAKHGAIFEDYKTEIQRALSMHTARGVDAANEKLDSMESKFDQFLQVLSKLDSPRERDVKSFLRENGGERACIESGQLLDTLVSKSGETVSADVRTELLKEWQEDAEEMFKKNLRVFEGKLGVQVAQLQEAIRVASDYIVTTLRPGPGPDEKISDPNLRAIWKEMGWKGSVKARHFVLALHDHYSDARAGQDPSSMVDGWALEYVNVAYVQPILEAVDDDGTGFVSVKEVNAFTNSAPREWTLLQRLAYWAAGWQISLNSYQWKIFRLVQQMFKLRDHVVNTNRCLVDQYLASHSLTCLQHVLRSIKHVPGHVWNDTELSKLVDKTYKEEEERLERNLNLVAYEFDSEETISLVTGSGRIEHCLLPLVYLLLKHDLHVMKLACMCTIREEELSSLDLVFQAVHSRVQGIAGVFEQLHVDVNVRLGMFAFGMFRIYHNMFCGKRQPMPRVGGLFLQWADTTLAPQLPVADDEDLQDEIPTSELKLKAYDSSALETDFMTPSLHIADIPDDSLLGYWSGYLRDTESEEFTSACLGLMEFRIDSLTGGKIAGAGQASDGPLAIDGTLDEDNNIRFDLTYDSFYTLHCEGKFDPHCQRIEVSWTLLWSEPLDLAARNSRLSFFWRTPSHLHRFRYDPVDFQKSPASARWSFACNSILHEIRRKSWSWVYLKAQIGHNKRLIALSIRKIMMSLDRTPNSPLNQEEIYEINMLRMKVGVYASRLCEALALFYVERLMVYHPGVNCDSCGRCMCGTRNICLVCVEKDFTDHIDLCRACLTASVSRKRFLHNPSHSMIKYEYVVHDYQEVLASRKTATNAKIALGGEAPGRGPGKEASAVARFEGNEAKPRNICICCLEPVTIPCWVCRMCSPNTFICNECEEGGKAAALETHAHKLSHPLIRIGTTDPDSPVDVDEPSIEERLVALEKKMDERTTQIERRVAQLETKMQEQLAGIESLLRQVVAHVGAAPHTRA